MENFYNAIIIGGGPAGSAAAYNVARTNYKTLVIDKEPISGSLGMMNAVRGFPGIVEEIKGTELVERMQKQAQGVGAEFIRKQVTKIEFTSEPKEVHTSDGTVYKASIVILSSGVHKERTYVPGEKELIGKGVSYDAYFDASYYKNEDVVVIGKTEKAAIETIFISRFAKKIYFIIPGNKLDISDLALKTLTKNGRIEFFYSASLKSLNGTESLESVSIYARGQEKEFPVKAAFIYTPTNKVASDFPIEALTHSENGAIHVTDEMSTSVPGTYACGNVICGDNQQAIISAAQGVIAGVNAEMFLRSKEQEQIV